MRLKALKLKNFRGYVSETTVPLEDLTVLVGRNDAGKSTLMEALAIFFDDDTVKFGVDDLCSCAADKEVRIGCVFEDLPSVVVDSAVETTLGDEYLLNAEGDLEIHRIWNCTKKTPDTSMVAVAWHPTAAGASDLLLLKQADLRKRCDDLKLEVNRNENATMRTAIRDAVGELALAESEIPLSEAGARDIWAGLSPSVPVFALFKSDRPSVDQDPEVQDPMNTVVKSVMKRHDETLKAIHAEIEAEVQIVAARTLEKLRGFDAELAETLQPVASKSSGLTAPKFGLTDGQVSVNKRGSGTRRLVLLSFFQAEAEERCVDGRVIYAIEEPETSQHPSNVQKIMASLVELSGEPGVQVILTTHVPALAGMAPSASLRHVVRVGGAPMVNMPDEGVLQAIAKDLGVLPESFNGVQVVVCVEGPHDVRAMRQIMSLAATTNAALVDVSTDPRVMFLSAGGSTLKAWVDENYLEALNLAEVHIYDRDGEVPKYADQVQTVNDRPDTSCAFSTDRRELENYFHTEAIKTVFGVDVVVEPMTDVPSQVAQLLRAQDTSARPWAELDDKQRKRKEGNAKKRLNGAVVDAMTVEHLRELGVLDEVITWVTAVGDRLN